MAQRIHPITMPKWGIEMQEGTITTWNIAPGQAIGKGENLLEVETEKIVNSVEAPIAGTLRRIVGQPGEVHKVTNSGKGEAVITWATAFPTEDGVFRILPQFTVGGVYPPPNAPRCN